ncbi:putative ferredoxin hydrogenase [Blattamonas nauphoetae]|uniref:Ferredoxin hydrogenase n=1 Tax=Blattamonas nauphoetae TaxID=2049346 RepID=A0ABQ9WNK0_9EUKA|nr:putative ferredoxin hydrogenase [Blattamonas nauphoetae]
MPSMIFDVARYLHQKDRPMIATFAPAVFGQFPASQHHLRNACLKCGFSDMVEVSLGADTTSLTEAAEFLEHVGTGAQPVLMTSCCSAWVRAVRIHVPKLLSFLSDMVSPMKYTGDMLKARDPDCFTVFLGHFRKDAGSFRRVRGQLINHAEGRQKHRSNVQRRNILMVRAGGRDRDCFEFYPEDGEYDCFR